MKRSRLTVVSLVLAALTIGLVGCASRDDVTSSSPTSADTLQRSATVTGSGFYTVLFSPEDGYVPALGVLDTRTGEGTSIGIFDGDDIEPTFPGAFFTPYGVAFDLDGTLYAILNWFDGIEEHCESQLATVDPETGTVTPIGPRHPLNLAGPEVGPDGTIYATGFTVGDPATGQIPPFVIGDSNLYRFDKFTGDLTLIGDTGSTYWMDMAFGPDGRLWATYENELFVLDTETGAATFMMHVEGVPMNDVPGVCEADWPWMEIMSLDFDRHGNLFGAAMRGFSQCAEIDSPFMEIDLETGQATVLGYTGQGYNHGGDIPPEKVTICHRNGRGKFVEIRVSIDALDAHRAHGDVVPGVDYEGCGCPEDENGRSVAD